MRIERPIEVSFLWDVREHHAAQEAQFGMKVHWAVRAYTMLAGLLVAGTGAVLVGRETALLGRALGLVPVAVGAFTVACMTRWGRRIANRWGFQRAGALIQPDQKFTFVIDELRVHFRSPGAESSCVWELVPLVVETPAGFLLQADRGLHWLPRHAFKTEDDESAFATLARSKASKFRQHTHF